MRIAKRRLRKGKIKQATAKMRGASPSGSAAKPRLPPLFIFRPFAAIISFLSTQQFNCSFGQVGLRRVPVSAARARGFPKKRAAFFGDCEQPTLVFKTGTRLTTICILNIQKVFSVLNSEQLDEL